MYFPRGSHEEKLFCERKNAQWTMEIPFFSLHVDVIQYKRKNLLFFEPKIGSNEAAKRETLLTISNWILSKKKSH